MIHETFRRGLKTALFILCISHFAAEASAQDEVSAQQDEASKSFLPEQRPGFAKSEEAQAFTSLCPTVMVTGLKDVNLGPMEVRLLCGDPGNDQIGKPWSQIPPNQAAYFLKGFLQARGYHLPEFIQDGSTLFARTGPRSRLEQFNVVGGPEQWVPPKRRLIDGLPLTPPLLDDLSGWALNQIKNEGYACAEAKAFADPKKGLVVVELDPGKPKIIKAIEDTGDTGLRKSTLDRYNAFRVGDLYREYLISLTRNRVVEEGFLQTVVYTTRCEEDGVVIVRDVVLGPSRTLRIGLGASTEEGPRFRILLRQNRLGSAASTAEVRLTATYFFQVLDADMRWYYDFDAPRSFLLPSVSVEHRKEEAYETQAARVRLHHGWGREAETGQMELIAGPTAVAELQKLDALEARGSGPANLEFVMLEASARWTNHLFEYFAGSPRGGEFIEGSIMATRRAMGAPFDGERLQLSGQKLWEIFRYDPPYLILGTRFLLTSVFSPEDLDPTKLPLQFLSFVGGEADLRGFTRRSLPRNQTGSLSSASVGAEARLHKVIFRRADAFGFVDAGLLGGKALAFDRPLFMSPGLGVRWESPVGVFRTYAAQRLAVGERPEEEPYIRQWRFGFTYGEEF